MEAMEEIQIEFLSVLADLIGKNTLVIEVNHNSTIKEVFEELVLKLGKKFTRYIYNPDEKKISKHSLVILNNKDINYIDGIETQVKKGDKILFIPAIAGG